MNVAAVEVRKAFGNRWFAVSLFVGCVLALASAVGSCVLYGDTLAEIIEWWGLVAPSLSAVSCFRFFMTSDYIQAPTDLFYALVPLLATVPYGWSLCEERHRGYAQHAFLQCGRVRYVAGKALAAAASGGVVVAVPLILNCVACACFIPAYEPDVATVFNTGVYETVMGSELYYNVPVLFVGFYIALTALFGAGWAAFVLLMGGYAHDGVRLIAGLFVLLYLFGSLEYKLGVLLAGSAIDYLSTSPLVWLRGVAIGGNTDVVVAVAWLVGLLALSVAFAVRWGKEEVL